MAPTRHSVGSNPPSSDESGNLDEIAYKLEPHTGKIPLACRCHRLPRKLEYDYHLTSKVLGTGYSGSVRLAKSRTNTGQTVAVKTFKLKGLSGSKRERLMSEISVFLRIDHPHVARLLDVYESGHHISLVMECMEGGELFDRVTQDKRFSESGAADATRQMLLALHYLHSHDMVHRDLKLENFLYDHQGGNHLKMIDFGFSKFSNSKGRMKTSCGTLAYVAPEVLKRSYTSQCDLWSMGVIVFILLSGHMPFHGDSEEQLQDIKKGRYTFKYDRWSIVSKTAQDFTKALLEVDPAKRLTSKTALEHVWLAQSFQESTPQPDSSILAALRSWTVASKLQRVCMSLMAWSLTNEHHEQVRDHFLALDRNHDGAISLDELRYAMQRYGCESEGEVCHVFEMLTSGHEVEIHYSDFLAAMVCSHLELDEGVLQVTFKKFDVRGTGLLAPQDLKDVLGSSIDGADAEALIGEGDIGGDGMLDFDEFAAYVRTSRADLVAQRSLSNIGDQTFSSLPTSLHNREMTRSRQAVEIDNQPLNVPQACCVVQ